MATLQRRVQVLFDEEQYARLQNHARRHHQSVGAVIRQATEEQLRRDLAVKREAFEWLMESSRQNPGEPMGDWDEIKASFDPPWPGDFA